MTQTPDEPEMMEDFVLVMEDAGKGSTHRPGFWPNIEFCFKSAEKMVCPDECGPSKVLSPCATMFPDRI